MQVVLSIDPAAKAGGCVFVDGKLHKYLEFNGASFWDSYEAMGSLLEDLPEDAFYLCLIEEGWPGAPGAGSLTLGRRRGLIQAAAEALGIQQMLFISPGGWQPKIIPGVAKGQTKVACQAYVKAKYGIEPGPDVCDAIGIHDYYANNLTKLGASCKRYTNGKLDVRYKASPRKISQPVSDRPKLQISRGKRSAKSLRSADAPGTSGK